MKSFGIRETKAHLSQLVRAAANGECSIVTDNGNPVAMIGPLPANALNAEDAPQAVEETKPLSNAAAFRNALLGAPYPLQLDF
jgi:prevent-host-death family protein